MHLKLHWIVKKSHVWRIPQVQKLYKFYLKHLFIYLIVPTGISELETSEDLSVAQEAVEKRNYIYKLSI